MVYAFLKNEMLDGDPSQKLEYYVPDRYQEGYGISFDGMDYALEKECSLVIALDCGIRANKKVAYAREKGIDVIICDHHLPGEEIPEAIAVIDPKRADCRYPYKGLSGCAVGFKFLQGFCQSYNIDIKHLTNYLDLVAVSICADIVPLTGENRILTYHGLKKLNTNPGRGLAMIIDIAGLENKDITVEDVVFRIGPRINAAGRIKSGTTAVELLIAEEISIAKNIAKEINDYNTERKDIDKEITAEALAMIGKSDVLTEARSTVLFNEQWHKGVIGIVASRLIESYYRPTIVLTKSNGLATGSGRSIMGFDLYEAINHCSGLLEHFGGHEHAAGLSLKIENIPAFTDKFEAFVNEKYDKELFTPHINIDAEIELNEITHKFYRIIKQFEPCGPENMAPVFCTKNVTHNNTAKIVGSDGSHLKLNVCQKGSKPIPAIAFKQAHYYHTLQNTGSFDVCYAVEMNVFNGRSNLQLNIKDIKVVT
jgi:single-stranded-DNA-specific exonuclease